MCYIRINYHIIIISFNQCSDVDKCAVLYFHIDLLILFAFLQLSIHAGPWSTVTMMTPQAIYPLYENTEPMFTINQ